MATWCPRFLLALVGLLLASRSVPAADELADKIKAIVTGTNYQHARWGILVVDAETGKAVYEHNPDQLFVPASVTKLYSCAAALAALGPNYQFETPVYRRGELQDGRLKGDLILVARGDPTLGGRTDASGHLAFRDHDHIYAGWSNTKAELTDTDPLAGLKALARQVKDAGIKQVDGDVLIDDRLFDHARGSGSGPSLLTPIMVNDNLVDVIITPAAKEGEAATFQPRPMNEFVQIDVGVQTVAEGKKTEIRVERVGPQRYVIRGEIPVKSRPVVRICPIDDPAGFARALFIDLLRREGLTIRASALRAPTAELPEKESYARLPRVAFFTSPPFAEVLKVTLKVSHNLYASTLPLLIAVQKDKRTLKDGLRLEGKLLAEMGVDVESISLESGAGGGNGDRVTPRTTVQLLKMLAKRPDWPIFKAALPILGVDGTLAEAVGPDSPARGKVFGKTGTYDDSDLLNDRSLLRSKSLAGVMTSASGRPLVFAIFVNDVSLPKGVEPTREGKTIGRLCEIVYQNAR
jgi:D-alanyl-D-alanine carboxypeptidase/D-alanyl-D-alanine-endopeptidase (penicillin-binding protein 4)